MTPDQRSEALLLADELSLTPLADLATVADKSAALLRELASEPQGEPVAQVERLTYDNHAAEIIPLGKPRFSLSVGDKLYTHPPQQRKPLTRLEIIRLMEDAGWQNSALLQADLDGVERVVRVVERIGEAP